MAGTKTIYNSSTLECVLEVVYRLLGVKLDADFVSYSLDRVHATLTITALPQAADGRKALYSGTLVVPYTKQDLSAVLPQDIVYGETYPISYDRLKTYLSSSYDYLVEDGEFCVVGDTTQTPLMPGATIGVQPDEETGLIQLATTAQAGRWVESGLFPLTITAPGALLPGKQLTISGDAPNVMLGVGYDFTYAAQNGTPPLTWSVVDGAPPAPLDPVTGSLFTNATQIAGSFTWTIRCTDAAGRFAELVDSCEVEVPAMQLPNPYSGTVTQASALSHQYAAQGGLAPYSYASPTGLPRGLAMNSTGLLSGMLDGGTYTFDIKATDSLGNTVTIHETITAGARAAAVVIAGVWSKLAHWYDCDDGRLTAGGVVIDRKAGLNLIADGVIGSSLSNMVAAHDYVGISAAAASGAGPAFTDNFAVLLGVKSPGSSFNQGIVGRMDSSMAGWMISSTTDDGTIMQLQYQIGDSVYSARSTAPYATGAWVNALVQRDGAYSDFFFNNGNRQTTPGGVGSISQPTEATLTVGMRTDFTEGTEWTGSLENVVLFTDKLWDDERSWMWNGGAGRTYAAVKAAATSATLTPLSITGTPPAAVRGVAYSYAFTIAGGQAPYSRARLVVGMVPDGMSLTLTGATIVLSGTPTITGSFSFSLAVDSADAQDALLNTTISVAVPLTSNNPAFKELIQFLAPSVYYRLGDVTGGGSGVATDTMGNLNGTYGSSAQVASVTGLLPSADADKAMRNVTATGSPAMSTVTSALLQAPLPSFVMLVQWDGTTLLQTLAHVGDRTLFDLQGFDININTGAVVFNWWSGSVGYSTATTSTAPVVAHQPVLLGVDVLPAGKLNVFINGVLLETLTGDNPFKAPTSPCTLWLAQLKGGNTSNGFIGTLDEFSFFPSNLTAAQHALIGQASRGELLIFGKLASAVQNQPYSSTLRVGGGSGAYQNLRISAGALPSGLAMTLNGQVISISGTAAASGTYPVTVSIDTAAGQTATFATNLVVSTDTTGLLLATWDAGKSNSQISLSGDNRTATWGTNDTTRKAVGSAFGKATGKWTFQVRNALPFAGQQDRLVAGLINDTFDPNSVAGTTYGLGQQTAQGGLSSVQLSVAFNTSLGGVVSDFYAALVSGDGTGRRVYASNTNLPDFTVLRVEVNLDAAPQTVSWYYGSTLLYSQSLPPGQTWYPAAWTNSDVSPVINAGQEAIAFVSPGFNSGWWRVPLVNSPSITRWDTTTGSSPGAFSEDALTYHSINNSAIAQTTNPIRGKRYWELTCPGANVYQSVCGIRYPVNGNYFAQFQNGYKVKLIGGSQSWSALGSAWGAANDVFMFAYDATTAQMWIGKNGVWFSGNPANADTPAWQPTDGTLIGADAYPFIQVNGSGEAWVRANFGATPFVYTPPAGFSSYDAPVDDPMAVAIYSRLVAWYPFNETSGTTIHDAHNGYHMTLQGSSYALGQSSLSANGAASLQWLGNGTISDTFAKGPIAPGSLQGTKNRSVYTWYKPTSFGVQNTPIETFASGEDEPTNVQLELYIAQTTGKLGTLWEYTAGNNVSTVGPVVTLNTSSFIGYSMDANAKKVTYTVNATDSAGVSYSQQPTGGTSAMFYAGTVDAAGAFSSAGYQQDSLVLSDTLTQAEKLWLYNGGAGRTYTQLSARGLPTALDAYKRAVLAEKPVAYYRLNETSGTQITDSSGNGFHGTFSTDVTALAGPGLITTDTAAGALAFGLNNFLVSNASNNFNNQIFVTNFGFGAVIAPTAGNYQSTIGAVVQMGAGGNGVAEIDIVDQGDNKTFQIRIMQSGITQLIVTRSFNYGGVYHLFLQYSTTDGTSQLYVDGELMGTAASSYNSNGSPWKFGAADFGSSISNYPFIGRMAEIAIYNHPLRPESIRHQSALAKLAFSAQPRYWRVLITAIDGGTEAALQEIELHSVVGGANILTPSTPVSVSDTLDATSSYKGSNLVDGDVTSLTSGLWLTGSGTVSPTNTKWAILDLQNTRTPVVEVKLWPENFSPFDKLRSPVNFLIQSSKDSQNFM